MTSNIRMNYKNGLVPAVIQDMKTGDILMLGYMNFEALEKTLQTGFVYFWSRSKKRLWMKGEKSDNKLQMIKILSDCDDDALVIKVRLIGNAVCHKGYKSCFQEVQ